VWFVLSIGLIADGSIVIGSSFLRFFTHWGLIYDMIYFGIGACCSYFMKTTKYKNGNYIAIRKAYRILFEIGWMISWLVSVVFWAILFPVIMIHYDDFSNKAKWNTGINMFIYNICVHSLPLTGMILEMIYNKMVFVPYHSLFGVLLIAIYGLLDSILTFLGYGEAYEYVLTWTNWLTVVVIVGFMGIALGAFGIGYKISQRKLRKTAFAKVIL
jgi:hypothetical protein